MSLSARLAIGLHGVRRSIAARGLVGTALHIARHLYHKLFPRRLPTHTFDLEHGVDTSQLIGAYALSNASHAHAIHTHAYLGSAPSLFRTALAQWRESLAGTPHTPSGYTFVDIGCGAGRALMLASETAFHRVLGIELNPSLALIAQSNITRWTTSSHACNDITILNADALAFPFPATPTLVYLFNPFDAFVMRLLLDRLQSLAHTRAVPIDILYVHPDHAALFTSIPGMTLLWDAEVPYSPEDMALDPQSCRSMRCCLYRLLPPA
jgi:SAM-dependent methyltransferase